MWCVVKDAEQRVYAQHGGGPSAAQGSYEPSDIARIRYEHIVSAKLDERQQTRQRVGPRDFAVIDEQRRNGKQRRPQGARRQRKRRVLPNRKK